MKVCRCGAHREAVRHLSRLWVSLSSPRSRLLELWARSSPIGWKNSTHFHRKVSHHHRLLIIQGLAINQTQNTKTLRHRREVIVMSMRNTVRSELAVDSVFDTHVLLSQLNSRCSSTSKPGVVVLQAQVLVVWYLYSVSGANVRGTDYSTS